MEVYVYKIDDSGKVAINSSIIPDTEGFTIEDSELPDRKYRDAWRISDGKIVLDILEKSKLTLSELKKQRDEGQYLPIEVNGSTYDAHEDAQRNIETSIRKFEVIDSATRNDGTIDWTLADNSVIQVTKQDLIEVENAITLRYMLYHQQYTEAKLQQEVP